MQRFGDFSVLEFLGESEVADRCKAMHDALGGPFYVKRYGRLPSGAMGILHARCERLMSVQASGLPKHLGHGDVAGVPFAVYPYLDGVDLLTFMGALREKRGTWKIETVLYIVMALAKTLEELEELSLHDGKGPFVHGAVSAEHVRLGHQGEVWLTGLATPRELVSGVSPEARWDVAGLAAIAYELLSLTRPPPQRATWPMPLLRVMRRGLGLQARDQDASPRDFSTWVAEAMAELGLLPSDAATLAQLVAKHAPAAPPPEATLPVVAGAGAAALPFLEPEPGGDPFGVATDVSGPPAQMSEAPDLFETEETAPAGYPELPAPGSHHPSAPQPAVARGQPPPAARTSLTADELFPLDAPTLDQLLPAAALPADMEPFGLDEFPTELGFGPDEDPFGPAVDEEPGHGASPFGSEVPRGISMIMDTPALGEPRRRDGTPPAVSPSIPFASPEPVAPAAPPPMPARSDPGVAALIQLGVATAGQVARAGAIHAQRGGRLLETLIASEGLSEVAVADALAHAAQVSRITDQQLAGFPVEARLYRRIPQTYAQARRLLPLRLVAGALELAVADPFAQASIEETRALLGATSVRIYVATRRAIAETTAQLYRATGAASAVDRGEGPLVLLCVADGEQAGTIGARLAMEGFRITHADSEARAQGLLEAGTPDAVLVVSGDSTAGAEALLLFARGHERHEATPVYVVGPAGKDDVAARMLDLGADDYFARPMNLDVMIAKLRRAVVKRTGGAARSSELTPLASTQDAGGDGAPDGLFDFPGLDDLPASPSPAPLSPEADEEDDGVGQPTGVMGTLRQMSVAEIVQSLELGRKTAQVELHPLTGDKGTIAFENGQVVYAECAALRGEEAFYALAVHVEGFFRIRYGEPPTARNIDSPTTYLLLEALRRLDEGELDLNGL